MLEFGLLNSPVHWAGQMSLLAQEEECHRAKYLGASSAAHFFWF